MYKELSLSTDTNIELRMCRPRRTWDCPSLSIDGRFFFFWFGLRTTKATMRIILDSKNGRWLWKCPENYARNARDTVQ